MTAEQREILKQQAARVAEAKRAHEREIHALRALLIMHDARFADEASGLRFNPETLTIEEPDAT